MMTETFSRETEEIFGCLVWRAQYLFILSQGRLAQADLYGKLVTLVQCQSVGFSEQFGFSGEFHRCHCPYDIRKLTFISSDVLTGREPSRP
jgi:hypothetical protein